MYAGTAQSITFELRDANSNVIDDTTISVQTGKNTLFVDFDVPVGNNLQLGVSANNSIYIVIAMERIILIILVT